MKQNVLQLRVSKLLNEPPYGRQNQKETRDRDTRAGPRTALPCYSATPVSTPTYKSWIIERLDTKLADVIGSNTVEKCDVTLSRAIKPYTHLTNKKRIPLRDFLTSLRDRWRAGTQEFPPIRMQQSSSKNFQPNCPS